MYQVGVKGGNWLFVTDGLEIYGAEDDVRYSSGPQLPDPGYRPRTNRITRLVLTQAEFARHCASNNIELRGCIRVNEKAKQISGPAVGGGILGALFGGPVGAVLGAGVAGWLYSGSDFTDENIASVFNRAKANQIKWKNHDEQKAKIELEQIAEYQKVSQERWRRYHKIRNVTSVDELTGIEFEAAVASLYERTGYTVMLTKASGDFGVDVLAKKGTEFLAIQVKRYTGNVGVRAVQEVASGAHYYKATTAVVITNSFFTEQARKLAKSLPVTLINKKRLANMWESSSTTTSIPPFDIQQYEAIKPDIDKELHRLDVAAGKKFSRRFVR
ncbi:MAG: restriction endonuclease [Nitrospirota bacterium]|nr:restriction endonuclease [Nitrospirota bacterium]